MQRQLIKAFEDLSLAKTELENSRKQLLDTSNGAIKNPGKNKEGVLNACPGKLENVEASNQQEMMIKLQEYSKEEWAQLLCGEEHLREKLQAEIAEVKQQLTAALADKEVLSDENQAKTQQVKVLKKQLDNLIIQLEKSDAQVEQYHTRLCQCESDLVYCRKELQAREEDVESKVMETIT